MILLKSRTLLGALLLSHSLTAQFPGRRSSRPEPETINIYANRTALAKELPWRELGPANHSGRIVDLAVHPRDKSIFYVASATGGLWKTENRGFDFKQVFKEEGQTSIGDIAIDPGKPETIWVGTGEANNQRSSYHGDGIWRSDDGGGNWRCMGLRDSHHIGRILVDPANSDRVFVAALGHLYTPNEERGLYRTEDGGKTWRKVLGIDENVGVVDVAMKPGNPKAMIACSYERRRRAWNFDPAGPGSRVWRSEDGGSTWKPVTKGLPSGEIGRIGVAFSASHPDIAYLTVENANPRTGRDRRRIEPAPGEKYPEEDLREFFGVEEDEAVQGRRRGPRLVGGEIYRSEDGGRSWKKTNRSPVGGRPAYYYGQIRVDPRDPDLVYVLSVSLYVSRDGGRTFSGRGAPRVHVDHHALWVDPAESDHLLLGNDGGLCESYDGGKTWIHYENLPLGQYYAVGVDMGDPFRAFGGTQDNGSWGVPSRGPLRGRTRLQDAFKIYGGDGFYVVADPEDPNIVYAESQFGGLGRVDLRTMERKPIRPRRKRGEKPHRFNWMSPILVSPHNHTTLYFGGNKVFKSLDRGDHWKAISPDLTTRDPNKIAGNVPHCTITTIAESELRQGLIWVGTDDGKLWLTPDDGRTWKDLTSAIPGEAQGLWVSRVEASRAEEGRSYVSYTGYREDRFDPLLYVTEDYGLTFEPIHGDLPEGEALNVVREDPRDPDLLFVGTEGGAYVSLTRGGSWVPLGRGLPRAPVHDLAVHPRDPEVVAGTHGRGMHLLDVAPLEHWTVERASKGSFVVRPRTVRRFPRGPMAGYMTPVRVWRGEGPPAGVELCAFLAAEAKEAALRVLDLKGKVLKTFKLSPEPGFHQVRWAMSGRRGFPGFPGFRGFRGRSRSTGVGPGTYRVELVLDGETLSESFEVR